MPNFPWTEDNLPSKEEVSTKAYKGETSLTAVERAILYLDKSGAIQSLKLRVLLSSALNEAYSLGVKEALKQNNKEFPNVE